LDQRRTNNELPPGALREGLVQKHSRGCAFADEGAESSIVGAARLLEPAQRRDLTNESAGVRRPFRELRLPRDPDCPGCGNTAVFGGYEEIQQICVR